MNKKSSTVKNIIVLHGWGLFGARYKSLAEILSSAGFKVYAPDLPGFGNNKNVKGDLTLPDYASYLKDFIEKNKITSVVLLGHSFGGRVIICFLDKYKDLIKKSNIKAIVLTGSPLTRSKLSLRKKIGIFISKTGKGLVESIPVVDPNNDFFRKLVYKIIGEWDYYKAGQLKKTFVNIINYDLEDKLSEINLPTLIIWGENDRIVSYSDALKLNKLVTGSKLVGVKNATHKLPYEQPEIFASEVISFLNSL